MDIELEFIIAKMKELQMYAEMLMEIRFRLSHHKDLLNDAWVSDEMQEINDVLEMMDRQMKRISAELYGIGHDMLRAYEES